MRGSRGFLAILGAALLFVQLPAGQADHERAEISLPAIGAQVGYEPLAGPHGPFTLRWQATEPTLDAWHQPVQADVLAMAVPFADFGVEPSPTSADGNWIPVREAFTHGGDDPLWRSADRAWQWGTGNAWLNGPFATVGLPAPPQGHELNLTELTYRPAPWLRTCLAHHGLQGTVVASGDVVDLAAFCPGLVRRGVTAAAGPANGTLFQGRAAVELRYVIGGGGAVDGDLPLPNNGTLRLVLADSLAYVAEAQVLDEKGVTAWSFRLTCFEPGDGPRVPGWDRDAPQPPPAPFPAVTPLGRDGPATGEGPYALPYPLEQALANLRASPAVAPEFHRFRLEHPDAFVAQALAWMGSDTEVVGPVQASHQVAMWEITFAAARPDGTFIETTAGSQLSYPESNPGPGLPPGAGLVVNYDRYGPRDGRLPYQPDGWSSLDFSAAISLAERRLDQGSGPAGVQRLAYAAPAGDTGPLLGVELRDPRAAHDEEAATTVVLDGGSGAAVAVLERHYRVVDGSLGAPYRPLDRPGEESLAPSSGTASRFHHGPEIPLEIRLVGLTAGAVVAGILAYTGKLGVLYTRLRPSDVLDNDLRRRIYELVRANPGIHYKAIRAELGLGGGAAYDHLRVLQKASLLTCVKMSRYRRYYVTGTVAHGELRPTAELQTGSARRVYDAVRQEPGLTLSALARKVEVSPAAAHRTVARLQGAGLLEKRPQGATVRIIPREPLTRA